MFEVLMAGTMKITHSGGVILWSLVESYQHFEGTSDTSHFPGDGYLQAFIVVQD